MKRPPMLMRVQIRGEGRGFCLWLPLFVLLPLTLVLLIGLSPLILLAVFILWLSGRGRRALLVTGIVFRLLCSMRLIRAAVDLLCSMPGLRVDVYNRNQRIHVSVV
jgi:hypothetical protein